MRDGNQITDGERFEPILETWDFVKTDSSKNPEEVLILQSSLLKLGNFYRSLRNSINNRKSNPVNIDAYNILKHFLNLALRRRL